MSHSVNAAALASLALFAEFETDQLRRVAAVVKPASFPAGTEIFAAGDRASRLYVVCAGEVVIRFRPYDGGALDLANIPAGGAFGWSAALKRSYYTSAAIARTDVQALFIEASDLHRLMANDPELGRKLLEHTARQAALRPQVFAGQRPPARKPRLAQKASRIG